ncbi:MAG: glycosyltransferase 87 family protein [Candidatus Nanopelagicales bacterium]
MTRRSTGLDNCSPALTAVGSSLVTAGAAWIVAPTASRSYFGGVLVDSNRIAGNGSAVNPGNQSINGLVWRLVGDGGSPLLWGAASLLLLAAWAGWIWLGSLGGPASTYSQQLLS